MPNYDYKCGDCGKTIEKFHGMNDEPKYKCESCNSENMKKMIGGGSGIHFKGSGFYVNDYKKSSETKKSSPTPKTTTTKKS